MSRRSLVVILGGSLIAVACGLLTKSESLGEQAEPDVKQKIIAYEQNKEADKLSDPIADKPPLPSDEKLPDNAGEAPGQAPSRTTHYDSKTLDEKVIEQAKLFGENPKTFRLLLRTEPDGTKIYRMLGMHVVQNPNGEEVFLPDDI
ncbi:MAG TPA: hypothetical protein VEL47_05880 [Myxococcota bacterium]|nr:hypothetical protein [Myxococcota bacterium]